MSKRPTVIEILMVIIVLEVIAAIIIPIIIKNNEEKEQKKYNEAISIIEKSAIKWYEENNLSSSKTISVDYLISEKYIEDNKELILENNMNCYNIYIENTEELIVEVTDPKNCQLVNKEKNNQIKLSAYKYNPETKSIVSDESYQLEETALEYSWSNTAILIVIEDDIEYLELSYNNQKITKNTGEKFSGEITSSKEIDPDNYINTIVIDAIDVTEIELSIINKNELNRNNITLKFDKEEPLINIESNNNWTSANKELKITSIDKHSGLKKVYINNTPDINNASYYNSQEKIITYKKEGTYYIWGEDIAGNISENPVEVIVDKIDTYLPIINKIELSYLQNASSIYYENAKLNIDISDYESGISTIKYCFTTFEKCTPKTSFISDNNQIVIDIPSNKQPQKICLDISDKAGNRTNYCDINTYLVDTTIPIINNIKVTSENPFKIEIKAEDLESDIKEVNCYYYITPNYKTSGNITLRDNIYICEFQDIIEDKNSISIEVVNNSGIQAVEKLKW